MNMDPNELNKMASLGRENAVKNLMLKKCVFLLIQNTKNYLINAKHNTT